MKRNSGISPDDVEAEAAESAHNAAPLSDIDHLVERVVSVDKITLNVAQSVIVTTEDKVRLCAEKFSRNHASRQSWVAPASLFVSLLVTQVTASFNEFVFSSAVWEAVFFIATITTLFWLIYSLMQIRKSVSVEHFIVEIQNSEQVRGPRKNER